MCAGGPDGEDAVALPRDEDGLVPDPPGEEPSVRQKFERNARPEIGSVRCAATNPHGIPPTTILVPSGGP